MSKHPIVFLLLYFFASSAQAQQQRDSILTDASLEECIQYALNHQPGIKQSLLDERIVNANVKSRLADWYPQINFDYTLQHYFKTPVTVINGAPVSTAAENFSTAYFSVNQNIFNRDVLLANRTAADVLQQSRQRTISNKIDAVVEVSRAFYDILLTERQVQVLDENIVRLRRSLQDAYNQYQGGIVDKTDYKRAQIALNNTIAERKRIAETIEAKFVNLKQLMGYPVQNRLTVLYDSLQMERDASMDTLQQISLNNRIEFQLLQTERNLLQSELRYEHWGYLPSISAVGTYNPSFQNDRFSSLYSNAYPSSFIGLQLSVPIFQGGKRKYNIRNAELQIQRVQLDIDQFTLQANTQYAQALATYKGNIAQLNALRENLDLATDVYNTLQLQYNSGIKSYLDVIIAETDLREAQLNYLNALFAALSSKLDFEKALGTVKY